MSRHQSSKALECPLKAKISPEEYQLLQDLRVTRITNRRLERYAYASTTAVKAFTIGFDDQDYSALNGQSLSWTAFSCA